MNNETIADYMVGRFVPLLEIEALKQAKFGMLTVLCKMDVLQAVNLCKPPDSLRVLLAAFFKKFEHAILCNKYPLTTAAHSVDIKFECDMRGVTWGTISLITREMASSMFYPDTRFVYFSRCADYRLNVETYQLIIDELLRKSSCDNIVIDISNCDNLIMNAPAPSDRIRFVICRALYYGAQGFKISENIPLDKCVTLANEAKYADAHKAFYADAELVSAFEFY